MGRVIDGPGLASECCPNCGYGYSTPPVDIDDFDELRDDLDEPLTPNFSLEETRRRVPTVQLIRDDEITTEVLRLTSRAPAYFWMAPASSSDYHHPACRDTRGLWVHTLMLSTVIDRLADSYVEQGRLSRDQIDYAHAAAILHDQRKNGPADDPQGKSTSDHDRQMADVVINSGLPDEIAKAVSAHMGPWYDGPEPGSDLDDLVHTADMVASTESITPAVQGPIPEELADIDIEEVDLR